MQEFKIHVAATGGEWLQKRMSHLIEQTKNHNRYQESGLFLTVRCSYSNCALLLVVVGNDKNVPPNWAGEEPHLATTQMFSFGTVHNCVNGDNVLCFFRSFQNALEYHCTVIALLLHIGLSLKFADKPRKECSMGLILFSVLHFKTSWFCDNCDWKSTALHP